MDGEELTEEEQEEIEELVDYYRDTRNCRF